MSHQVEMTHMELVFEETQTALTCVKSTLRTLNDLKGRICEETWLEEVTSAQETINSLQAKLSEIRQGMVGPGVAKSLDF